jgi:hypothetical protein
VNDLLWQHWMIMSEDDRECFAFSAAYECCEQFCFFYCLTLAIMKALGQLIEIFVF